MYLKFIGIKNIGAIEELRIESSFTEEGNPKPIVIVGENGTGKTILLSSLIDSFYEIGSMLFDNIGKQHGASRRLYKVQGGGNLRINSQNGFVALGFEASDSQIIEYADTIKANIQEIQRMFPSFKLQFQSTGKSITQFNNQIKKKLQLEWKTQAHYYQPAYRYEEPFWKNPVFYEESLFKLQRRFINNLNKEIEIISSSEKNKSFVMDIVLDSYLYSGENQKRLEVINSLIQRIKGDSEAHLAFNRRQITNSRITIFSGGKMLVPSIDCLSLGESVLFNMFVNIIRHCDLFESSMEEMRGIVVIDEVDIHLHSKLQSEILPSLIELFPKIQFILTTHSPLFVLGMQKEFGDEGFDLIEMPTGKKITTERFKEFDEAYRVLTETKKFQDDLEKQIANTHKSFVFVEGSIDIDYIEKICELFECKDILDKVQLCDGGGYQNLNKIWEMRKNNFFQNIKNKVLLLYDCDTKTKDEKNENLVKRIIPPLEVSLVDRGIENLFSKNTIKKIDVENPQFFTYFSEMKTRTDGKEETIPERYQVNNNQKRNLCNWICENGTKEDFENFKVIIEILENFLQEENKEPQ
ncbi:hypothetical protein CQA62_02045 [Helicobacter cholecystus]|uniref:AAA+ ATPase domain-containing protein n=1 Tax=Helicobacter cholecystus TaxID=45498 RepID=A0A3D8IW48_9HELI|nr:AAA family ATPase [Helicobacter cholecystus]RDU69452.1 hypothetical protein CQA62_02045 [Helicobacter cholecystus]VEJ24003.1 Predicted ATP-binding protein involved in virulence [Helicobacter cholecystus]